MKNKILALLLWLTIAGQFTLATQAQTKPVAGFYPISVPKPKYNFGNRFEFEYQRSYYATADTSIRFMNNFKSIMNAKHPIWLGVKLNPNLLNFFSANVRSISKEFPSYLISDSSEAVLIAYGVTKANIGNYRYHVVENDSVELVPWSKIPRLEQNYGASEPYGFIGKFKVPGKQILVEVVNIKNYQIREGVVFDWNVNFKPTVTDIAIDRMDDGFDLHDRKLNRGYARKFDQHTGMPLDFKFPVDSVESMRFNFKHHETVPYVVYLIKPQNGKVIETKQLGYYIMENYFDIDKKDFSEPGKYEIIIQRVQEPGGWPERQVLRIPFTVDPLPTDKKASVSFKQALPYIIATLTGVVLLFGGYYRRNQVKLARAAQEKQVVGFKLQSIRAQLNPHFMFNALTSIQNLINKNDITGANHYLAKFAGLTRQVLDSGSGELLSLEDELKILDDYLQMEQLRFGFKYEIVAADDLNKANTEIPAMLLQPFVENAVKHGVAILKEEGRVKVEIEKTDHTLVFIITDNGKGFDVDKLQRDNGYGIKLSEERVALLNQLYKEQPVTLQIDAQVTGTIVTLRLSNWV